MVIAFITLGGVLLIIGMILAFLSKDIKPAYIVAIAALIAVLGATFGGIGKLLQDIKSSKKQNDIFETGEKTHTKVEGLAAQGTGTYNKLQELENENKRQADTIKLNNIKQQEDAERIYKLSEDVNSKADSLIQANIESKNLYKELYSTQKELYNYQTGGDSYCYLTFIEQADRGIVNISIYQAGKYPINNLDINISDASHMTMKYFGYPAKHIFHQHIEKMGIDYSNNLCSLNLGDTKSIRYWVISFETKDGLKKWYQRVVFTPERLLNELVEKYNIKNHKVNYQVYSLIESSTSSDTSINNTLLNNPLRRDKKLNSIMQVMKECQSPGRQHNIDWKEYPHAANRQEGNSEYDSSIKELIYLPNAKDCIGYR